MYNLNDAVSSMYFNSVYSLVEAWLTWLNDLAQLTKLRLPTLLIG
jgi:hypothetical protein